MVMPGTTGREQSSEAGDSVTPCGIDPVYEWEVTLGQTGSQHEVQPVQRPGPEESGMSRPGSAWLAGVRQERWLNRVRPSANQAWPGFFQALAQLRFPLSDPHLPSILRSKPSQQCWLLCSLEGRQNPHSPAAWLCDVSLLVPSSWVLWVLNTGIAKADFWAPAFSFFDLILAA